MFIYLFLINLSSSLAMVGLIWFVQVVQYPSFGKFPDEYFQDLHSFHIFRTGLVVIPFMLAELLSSILLSTGNYPLAGIHQIGLALVLSIWISTFALQMQIHKKLNRHISQKLVTHLIKSNWIRTILWSLKGFLGLYGLKILLQ